MMTLSSHEKNDLISATILLSTTYSSLGDDQQAAAIQSHRRIHHGNKFTFGMTWAEKDGEIVVKHLLPIVHPP